jgi:hypothetical protein
MKTVLINAFAFVAIFSLGTKKGIVEWLHPVSDEKYKNF